MNFALIKVAATLLWTVTWSGAVRRRLERSLARHDRVTLVAVFAIYRLSACLLAFVVIGLKVPGDPVGPYTTFARSALTSGNVISPYSPGFDFLLAGLWSIFRSPLSFVFAMTLFEVVAFALFLAATERRHDEAALSLAVLWLVNPLSLFFVTLGGQDEALVLLAWCAVFWAAWRGRGALGGVLAGFGLVLTKILAVFAALPLLVMPFRRTVLAASLAVLVVAVFAVMGAWLRLPLFGFLHESRLVTPGNLWAAPEIVWGAGQLTAKSWQFGIAAVAMVASLAFVHARPVDDPWRQMLRITGVVGGVFLLTTPKAWTQYAVMFLPGILFLILSMPPRTRTAMLYVFLPVCTFEPSLWFYFSEGAALSASAWARAAMVTTDLVILSGYIALIWYGARLHRTPGLDTVSSIELETPPAAAGLVLNDRLVR